MVGKYLTFALDAEEYGVPVLQVREIVKLMEITAVPQTPRHVKGVINLRGKVIPIVDLQTKFDREPHAYTERTSIVVVEVNGGDRVLPMGVIVDEVSEVLNLDAEAIEETPDFGQQIRADFLRGVAKVKGRVKILLDLDRLLAPDAASTKGAPPLY